MRPGSPGAPPGIVFRRLHTEAERELARSLLAVGGPSPLPPSSGSGWAWFGLWDLAAPAPASLVGAAATRLAGPATVELLAVAVPSALPWHGLGDRLVREVADSLRAQGAERMVARLTGADGLGPELLRGAGFGAAGPQVRDLGEAGSAAGPTVWLSLEL